MSATFGSLKAVVSRKLIDANSTAVSASNVGDAINDAIRYWKYHRFWFNEKFATTTLNVNDPLVPGIPSDFLMELEENGFVIPYNNLTYTLNKKPPRIYDQISVKGLGLPYIYTWRAGSFYVYWFPNIAYTLNIYYLRDYDDLTSDSETNDFTNYAEKLIMYDALSRLTGEDRQDDAHANTFWGKALLERDNLNKRTSGLSATGQLTVETIL